MPLKTRPRLVASSSSTAKLFVDDLREVAALSNAENEYRSDTIRELVHEALCQRRLRALGRDEGENHVRQIYRETVADAVAPVIKELVELRQQLAIVTAQSEESAKLDSTTKNYEMVQTLLSHLLRQSIVTDNVVKVLMTVGMQKDRVDSEEIRKQLAVQDETGIQQARELIQKLTGDYPCAILSED